MSGARTAIVRMNGEPVGRIIERPAGGTRFIYDAAWLANADARPVSLTLPLRAEPYDSPGLHPFFDNLLPEGWLLQLSTSKLKIAPEDGFGLLLAVCADCVGDVEIVPDADPATDPAAVEGAS